MASVADSGLMRMKVDADRLTRARLTREGTLLVIGVSRKLPIGPAFTALGSRREVAWTLTVGWSSYRGAGVSKLLPCFFLFPAPRLLGAAPTTHNPPPT